MKARPRRGRGEAGFIAAEWALAVGLLLLPAGLLVVSFPRWSERQNMARVAAAEASRAVAVANDTDAGVADARSLVAEIARNHGVDPADVAVSFTGTTTRGGSVQATVSVQLPALSVPAIGSLGSVRWSTSHTEAVDQYRGFAP
ncbi:MAG: hypothetical protein ABR511_06260 [Acidimicrobiales bacterium]